MTHIVINDYYAFGPQGSFVEADWMPGDCWPGYIDYGEAVVERGGSVPVVLGRARPSPQILVCAAATTEGFHLCETLGGVGLKLDGDTGCTVGVSLTMAGSALVGTRCSAIFDGAIQSGWPALADRAPRPQNGASG